MYYYVHRMSDNVDTWNIILLYSQNCAYVIRKIIRINLNLYGEKQREKHFVEKLKKLKKNET